MLDTSNRVDSPGLAIDKILQHTNPVSTERVALGDAVGRVIAKPTVADRDSPPLDVSAMDGYAVRFEDLRAPDQSLPVHADAPIGRPPIDHAPGTASRVYTGAPVPLGADTILPREWVTEDEGSITLDPDPVPKEGRYIRRAGENCKAGERVLNPGVEIDAATASLLASLGIAEPVVHRGVRVSVLLPGDELLKPGEPPVPWKIRDGNGPGLAAMLGPLPWVRLHQSRQIADDPETIREALCEALDESDVVILTGGVSAGQRDFVPAAVAAEGGRTLFHGVCQRPGGPMLAAITKDKKLVLALPGNPVSALVCARIIGVPALRRLAGFQGHPIPVRVTLEQSPGTQRCIGLWWHRPVEITGPGVARLVETRGSGDTLSAARSDGVVQIPPDQAGPGPWPFYSWNPAGPHA